MKFLISPVDDGDADFFLLFSEAVEERDTQIKDFLRTKRSLLHFLGTSTQCMSQAHADLRMCDGVRSRNSFSNVMQ